MKEQHAAEKERVTVNRHGTHSRFSFVGADIFLKRSGGRFFAIGRTPAGRIVIRAARFVGVFHAGQITVRFLPVVGGSLAHLFFRLDDQNFIAPSAVFTGGGDFVGNARSGQSINRFRANVRQRADRSVDVRGKNGVRVIVNADNAFCVQGAQIIGMTPVTDRFVVVSFETHCFKPFTP